MKLFKSSLLFACLCFFFSCSDDEGLLIFEGEWQLTQISGGIGGGGVEFEGDLILEIKGDDLAGYFNDSFAFKANIKDIEGEYYEYVVKNIVYTDLSDNFNIGYSERMIAHVNDGVLTLNENCSDCFVYHFVKK